MKRPLQLIKIPTQETVSWYDMEAERVEKVTYKYELVYIAMPEINPDRILWNERQTLEFSDKDIEWDSEGNPISDGKEFVFGKPLLGYRLFVFGKPYSKPLKEKLQPWAFELIKREDGSIILKGLRKRFTRG